MKIIASAGLQPLVEQTEHFIVKTLIERGELGVDLPDDFRVEINYYMPVECDLETMGCSGEGFIRINAMEFIPFNINDSSRDVKNYFTLLSENFKDIGEERMLGSLANPKKFISHIQKRDDFPGFIEEIESRDITFKDFCLTVETYAPQIREKLNGLMMNILTGYMTSPNVLRTIRHETEHVAFHKTEEHRLWNEKRKKIQEGTNAASMREYLELTASVKAIGEQRAKYFSCIGYNMWQGADINKVKEIVLKQYCGYISTCYQDDIIDASLMQHCPLSEVSEDTRGYIWWSLDNPENASIARKFNLNTFKGMEDVDLELAHKVVDNDIPGWKALFVDAAKSVKDSIANYYKKARARYMGK